MTHTMSELIPLLFDSAHAGLARGVVVALEQDGVVISARGHEPRSCDHLAGGVSAALAEGDEVLVWLPSDADDRGIVIGQVRTGCPTAPQTDTPSEVVLEAKQSLTLRVGEGSITIREDGKILIKGKDLVSHAQRMNRIKGGAVSIN